MAICTECQNEFEPNLNQRKVLARSGRTYCSKVCSTRYQGRLSSVRMAATNRKYASARMKARNPMRDESTRRKVSATMKEMGHKPKVRGGNGQATPVPVRALADALGWACEVAVPTRVKRGNGYPTCYKLDIGCPDLMIGVEVDGGSHKTLERQEQDRKKESLLKSLGWTVLRFSNREVTDNLAGCVRAVESTTSKSRASTPTLRTAS